MNKLFGLVVIVFVGLISIRLMTVLSADAAAMAIGVLMGILAGVPTTLLGMTSSRRHQDAHQVHQARYTVLPGPRGAHVLDTHTGDRYAIVAPRFEVQR